MRGAMPHPSPAYLLPAIRKASERLALPGPLHGTEDAMAKAKRKKAATKRCKCGKVKGRNKCRKAKKGSGCPKRPRKRRRSRK